MHLSVLRAPVGTTCTCRYYVHLSVLRAPVGTTCTCRYYVHLSVLRAPVSTNCAPVSTCRKLVLVMLYSLLNFTSPHAVDLQGIDKVCFVSRTMATSIFLMTTTHGWRGRRRRYWKLSSSMASETGQASSNKCLFYMYWDIIY